MNRLVKHFVGKRDVVDGSGRVIASIERHPYCIGYRHITDDAEAPRAFQNLTEVREYYGISK